MLLTFMIKGIKVRIYPSKEQEIYISNLLGCCRLVYNETVAFYDKVYKETGKSPSKKEAYANFVMLKAENEFLREIHSKPLSEAFHFAINAYDNFFYAVKCGRDRHGKLKFDKPQMHKKRKHDSCLFPRQAFRYIRGNRISLVKKLSDIHFKCSREDEHYLNHHQKKIRSVTLRRKCSGIYTCSILVEDIRVEPLGEAEKGNIGIDVGIKNAVITSDGEVVGNQKIYESHFRRLAILDRRMNRCKVGSRRFDKARRRLAKCHEKIANVRDNFQHQISARLVKEHSGIFTENLDCNYMRKTLCAKRNFIDVSMRSLMDKIEYKCKWCGRIFTKVGRFFPSTRTCSKCGYVRPLIKLKEREWDCPNCGCHHDRDMNAAKNILLEGERMVGLGSPEPNARGHELVAERSADMDESRKKCSIAVNSVATEP